MTSSKGCAGSRTGKRIRSAIHPLIHREKRGCVSAASHRDRPCDARGGGVVVEELFKQGGALHFPDCGGDVKLDSNVCMYTASDKGRL